MTHELEIIAAIKKRARKNVAQLRLGIGDDAAVIRASGAKDFLACSDVSVEGVHFRKGWMSPELLGRKALAVTLSDIAAMGGAARFAMISIAIPPDFSGQSVDEIFAGLFAIADEYAVTIIGGDTSSSPQGLFIDTIVIGECEPGRAVTRAGARPGDTIFVSGSLGASGLGLKFLERGQRLQGRLAVSTNSAQEALIQSAICKHLIPEPQLGLGRALGEREIATAMIDLSDGMSSDLHHLLEASSCGALIRADWLPIAEAVTELSLREFQIEPLTMALQSGEEYGLLFTAQAEAEEKIFALAAELDVCVTAIGEITEGRELKLESAGKVEIVQRSGYEHKF